MSGWRRWLAASALGLLASAYFVAWRAPAAGTFHDDGIYMVTAKALAEGKGYRIISLPGEVPQTKYPVLFPLLLAAVWKSFPVFPENIPYLKLVALSGALLWFILIRRLLREEGASDRVAFIIPLLTASCGWVLYLSTAVLSETLFAMLTTASLIYLRRAEKVSVTSLGTAAIAAVLAALAFHTRSAGLALLVAAPLVLILRRKWLGAMAFVCTAAALCAPWLLWIAANRSASGVDAYESVANYQSWNILFGFTITQKSHILAMNLLTALAAPASLAGFPTHSLLLLPAVLAGVGILIGMHRSGANGLTLFLTAYVGLTLLWAWAPTRLLVPVLPFFYWFGYKLLAGRRRALTAACLSVCLASAFSLIKPVRQAIALGDAQPGLSAEDRWSDMQSLLEWVKRNTEPNAVLAGNLDPLYYLYTGRKATRGFLTEPYFLIYAPSDHPIGTPEQTVARLHARKVSYWILSPNSSFREGAHLQRMQMDLIAAHPEIVRTRYKGPGRFHDVLQLSTNEGFPATAGMSFPVRPSYYLTPFDAIPKGFQFPTKKFSRLVPSHVDVNLESQASKTAHAGRGKSYEEHR